MLLIFALQKAEKAINYYLSLDPEIHNKLVHLNDSVIKIELLTIDTHFYIKISDNRFQLIKDYNAPADLIIRGNPLTLLSLIKGNNENIHTILQNNDVTLIGKIDLALRLKNIFSQIEIDWEEYLSKICGDPLAHFIGTKFNRLKIWSTLAHKSLQRNINEYIHEEVNLFPSHYAYIDLFNDIDILRDDLERLTQRIDRIQKILSEQER